MEIDEHHIPDAIVDVYCRLVDKLDPALILAIAEENQKLFQGHRVILKNVPVARQRIKSSLKSEHTLDRSIAKLLQNTGLFNEVVVVISNQALEAEFSAMAIYFGESAFLAAALLDDRESTRTLAHEFISDWDGQSSDESQRKKAAEDIRAQFAPFLSKMKELLGEVLPPVASSVPDEARNQKTKLASALETAKAEQTRLSQRHVREQKDLQSKIDKGQQEANRLQTLLDEAYADSKAHKAEFAHLQKTFMELQASLQQRIDEGIGTALSDRLRQWLAPAISVEDALTEAKQSDLLVQAAEALKKQRSVDRHYGNRVELAKAIEERRQMLVEVKRARTEALNPLPELAIMATGLEHEISRLERRLGKPGDTVTAAAAGLLARINAGQSLDELSAVRLFIQQAATFELLRRDELHPLYRATNAKAGMFYDAAALSGEGRSGYPATRYFHPLYAAAHGQPFTLFIDGHNVLFNLDDHFGQYFENGAPGWKARTAFVNRLLPIFTKPGANVMVFFDGNDATEQSLSDYLRVFYSGGTGDHRADNAILEHIAFCQQSPSPAPLCLVTRDGDFARQAREMGAAIIDPVEFATFLEMAAA